MTGTGQCSFLFAPRRSLWKLLAFGFLSLAGQLHAQTPADRNEAARQSEIIQRQAQEQLQRDLDAARGAEKAPSGLDTRDFLPKADAPAPGGPCRNIQALVISGAPHLSAASREQVTREFSGRCIGVAEIEKILAEITKDYVERGFITTRAYLPPQDMSTGTLRIQVMEGTIQQIIINDGGTGSIQPFNAFPARTGELLNLRDLEQGIDQVNRLSSNSAQLDIKPGDEAGASTVVINNQPAAPFHASLSFDNQGSESTGKDQAGLTLIADRLLGFNELMVLTHRQSVPNDLQRKSSVSDSFSIVIPFGYSTLTASTSRSTYVTTINAPSGLQLRSDGVSTSDSLRLERVMYRDQRSRVSLSGSLTQKDSKNYLEGEYLVVSSRRLSVFDLGISASTNLLGGVISLDAGLSKGLTRGAALIDPDNLPDYAPRAQFEKRTYGGSYFRPFSLFDTALTFSSQLTGQDSRHTLYGSEQISIGGIYSVRGFSRNSLSGDKGYYLRNELSLRPTLDFGGQAIAPRLYVALDTGKVGGKVPGPFEGSLTGMAVGVSVAWKAVSVDLSYARPLSFPSFFSREAPQTWVRMSFSI